MTAQIFEFPVSAYVPLAIAFFGLGTGYLIYGPQELLGFPPRDARVDLANGWWGVWMPGFCQFVTGCWLMYPTYAIALNLSSGTHLPL